MDTRHSNAHKTVCSRGIIVGLEIPSCIATMDIRAILRFRESPHEDTENNA